MKNNFKLTNKDSSGTHLQGYIEATYKQIVEKLGKPNCDGDQYKVAYEWIIENERGEILTIYPWKNTNLYDSHPDSVEKMTATNKVWNIGGHDDKNLKALIKFLGAKVKVY